MHLSVLVSVSAATCGERPLVGEGPAVASTADNHTSAIEAPPTEWSLVGLDGTEDWREDWFCTRTISRVTSRADELS
jgi:hypothetical protein